MLVVCRVQSHRFVEKRGHPLNLALEASGYSLGLELQVPRLPVLSTRQKHSLIFNSSHFARFT